ncbi:MAG: Phosphoglycerate kinase [Candidatus Bathyarchaeota archaeon BA1]|nr:MAG: Phosphoglycerate kinase [Candidatus Bathyarchaeota archaeon BA1]
MTPFLTLDDLDFKDKTALLRVDFNSPVNPENKTILDDTRIRSHAETTIKELSEKGAKIVILAHQGRPGDPDFTPLKEHAEILGSILGIPVKYVDDVFGEKAQKAIKELKSGEILVLENVRTFPDETKKGTPEEHAKSEFVKKLAPLANVFVNDAFAAAHRSHISMVGFTAVLPSVAGRIMERELKALSKVLEAPEKPCVYILGGAKADDSLKISRYVLKNNIADQVLTGGIVGHLFLAAKGIDLGKPNMEFLEKKELMGLVPGIRELMNAYPKNVENPVDVAIEVEGKRKEITVGDLPTNYPICDIGTKTIEKYGDVIHKSKSIVISGPLGVFENKEFIKGTKQVFEAIAASKAFSLVGGGHTVAAVEELGLARKMSYVSTAGGALIEFLMGERLPGVVALEKAATRA